MNDCDDLKNYLKTLKAKQQEFVGFLNPQGKEKAFKIQKEIRGLFRVFSVIYVGLLRSQFSGDFINHLKQEIVDDDIEIYDNKKNETTVEHISLGSFNVKYGKLIFERGGRDLVIKILFQKDVKKVISRFVASPDNVSMKVKEITESYVKKLNKELMPEYLE